LRYLFWFAYVLKNALSFDGRACREEYWSYYIITLLMIIIATVFSFQLGVNENAQLYANISFYLIPVFGVAVGVRRLHDINRSGWWSLLSFIPLISVVFYFFMSIKGEDGPNDYGNNHQRL